MWKPIQSAYEINTRVEAKDELKDKYEYFILVLLCVWNMILVYDVYIWFMILIYDGCVLS